MPANVVSSDAVQGRARLNAYGPRQTHVPFPDLEEHHARTHTKIYHAGALGGLGGCNTMLLSTGQAAAAALYTIVGVSKM